MDPMTLPTLPSSPPPGTVMDLVCGMNVDPTKTKHSVTHEGKDYFFCSVSCLEKFRREPGKYLSGGGHEPMAPAAPAARDQEFDTPPTGREAAEPHPQFIQGASPCCFSPGAVPTPACPS